MYIKNNHYKYILNAAIDSCINDIYPCAMIVDIY